MPVFLDAIDGPFEGKSYLIREGYVIGRKQAQITLKDSKVSSAHARVERHPAGELTLVDLGSANGLQVKGRNVQKVALTPGVVFKLGRSVFQVREEAGKNDPMDDPGGPTWRQQLTTRLRLVPDRMTPRKTIGLPFCPTLCLEFLQGIQADERVILGYGPRTAGFDSHDIALWEPNCPAKCFQLMPGADQGAEFTTDIPSFVMINGKSIGKKVLEDGDVITMGYTKIRVSFVSEPD